MTFIRRILSLETEDIKLTADLDDARGVTIFWNEVEAIMKRDSELELPERGLIYCIYVKSEGPVVMAETGRA